MNSRALLETLADISYIAGENRFFTGDSRQDISTFIFWAKEFQRINQNTDWYIVDYRLAVEEFTYQKLNNLLN
jgi:hypothetical protein